jgi:hypothetical protein
MKAFTAATLLAVGAYFAQAVLVPQIINPTILVTLYGAAAA